MEFISGCIRYFIVFSLFTGATMHAQTLEEEAREKMDSLEVGNHDRIDLQIHSSSGQSIFTQRNYNTGLITHSIEEQADGFYIINIQSDEGFQNFIYAKICGP